jgi:RHS repeat-associated protein
VADGFGDLVGQLDAKGQLTAMTYDVLGRMTSRTDATGKAQWVYDVAPGAGIGKVAAMVSPPDVRLIGRCAVPFVTASDGSRAGRSFTYTAFGDVKDESACTDGDTFVTSFGYDALGRQSQVQYPTAGNDRLAVGYHYTNLGYLQYLTEDSSDYSVLWQATAMNALGQVTHESTRSRVETVATRNPATGWLMASSSTAHGNGDELIQSWAYHYDEAGNLLGRDRSDGATPTSTETFSYDVLDRLATSQMSAPSNSTESYDYDLLGNIRHKAGKEYVYGTCGAGPHAVCSVAGGAPFTYDTNGNMTNGAGRNITYNPSNKPTTVQNGTGEVDFVYGADGNRVVQIATTASSSERTVYVGLGATGKSLYERTRFGDGSTEHVHFIYAGGVHGGNAFAIRLESSGGASPSTSYYHFDHLGSVVAMSDERGQVTTTGAQATVFDYDAWGARRAPDGEAADPASFALQPGHREYTGHETIPNLGLVNMNGRVYDPVLGRFLSPDPNVQFAADMQSYNRYSYVLNNPLRYNDPTGYFAWWVNALVDTGITVAGIVVCAGTDGAGCGIVFTILATTYNVSSAIESGAGFDQIAFAGLSGAVGGGAGGAIGSAIAGSGAGIGAQILGGAVGGAVLTVMTSWGQQGPEMFDHPTQLGESVLLSASIGALMAGVTYAVQNQNQVSQASAAQVQGGSTGGGGSGAARVEKVETVESVLAANGCCAHVTDQELLDAYPNAPPLSHAEQHAIADLDPTVQDLAIEHRDAARRAGIEASLRPGFRTYAEQQGLLDAGSTEAGPGRSLHNFRLAYHLDVFVGNLIAAAEDPRWAQIADLAPAGIEAGANWDHPDPTHYEYRTDSVTGQRLSTDQLQRRWEANLDPLSGAPRNFHLCPQGVCP